MRGSHPSRNARLILFAQALRAFVYGFGAVLLGVALRERHRSATEVGVVFAAIVAGTACRFESCLPDFRGNRIRSNAFEARRCRSWPQRLVR
jgi:NhaP-type Na+/H+ or K+/H+ antiporter